MIVSIDANIGAGKSTLLKELRKMGQIVMEEGVGEWGRMLKRFYDNPQRWAFTLQVAIAVDMKRQYDHIRSTSEPLVFVERGPHSAMCFVRNSVARGHIDGAELHLYTKLQNEISWRPDVLVVIDADADMCLARVKQRGRDGEAAIDKEYLLAIEGEYKRMVDDFKNKTSTRIVHLDGRKAPEELARDLLEELEQ